MIKFLFGLWLGIFLLVSPAWAVPGASEVRLGNAEYIKGNYKQAAEKYETAAVKSPNDVRIDYDLGVARYKIGNYTEAELLFNKALLSEDEEIVQDAHYNLGNAVYKTGIAKEDTDIDGAIKNLESSLGHFDKVIAVNEKDLAAKGNRDFVASELERLRKKKKEQNKQSSSPSKKGQNQDSNNKQKNDKQKDKQEDKQKDKQDDKQNNEQKEQGNSEQSKQKDKQSVEDQESKPQQEPQSSDRPDKSEEQQAKSQDQRQPSPGRQGASSSAGKEETEHILSQEEANMLLDNFAQNEQPKGMLNFNREPRQELPVAKDW